MALFFQRNVNKKTKSCCFWKGCIKDDPCILHNVGYMAKCLWIPDYRIYMSLLDIYSKTMDIIMDLATTAAPKASTFLGKVLLEFMLI